MSTISELFKQGHTKMRLAEWALPTDHIEIYDAGDGYMGPWVKFWSELNEKVGNNNPVQIPIWEAEKETRWEPFDATEPKREDK